MNRKLDTIVIGSNLNALLYSFFNDIPFISTQIEPPYKLEYFDPNDDLSLFKFRSSQKKLISPTSNKISGYSKLELWNSLYFALSINGFNMSSIPFSSIKIEENIIKCITPFARMLKFNAEKIICFTDKNIIGLPSPINCQMLKYKVYDYIEIFHCKPHKYDYLETSDRLTKELIFYYYNQKKVYKNAISISYINEDELNIFDWSQKNVLFKTLSLLKELNIRRSKHFKIKVEGNKRIKIPLNKKNIYKDDNKFIFPNNDLNLNKLLDSNCLKWYKKHI